MTKLYTILILLSLVGCGKKEAVRQQVKQLEPIVDTSYYEASVDYPIRAVYTGVMVKGHHMLIHVQMALTPLSGGDIGKAEGER